MGIQINGTNDNISASDGSLTINGASFSTLQVNGQNLPTAGPLSNRNLIINGAMLVDQRNVGSSYTITGDTQYTLDRWVARTYSGTGRFSVQQDGSSPDNINPSAKLTVTTTDTPGTYGYAFSQRVEGYNFSSLAYGSSSAKAATISFWVRSSITGTYCFSVRNNDASRSYIAEYSISSANTWEYKTITIPGATDGTWLTTNGVGAYLEWNLGAQTSKESTAGSWQTSNYHATSSQVDWIATSGATFYITGVQLEVGEVATPFEHRNIGDELARCKRYYSKSYSYQDVPGTNTSDSIQGLRNWDGDGRTDVPANVRFPVEMRAAPTVKIYTRSGTIDNTSESTDGFTHAANRAVSAVRAVGRAGYSTLSHSASVGGLQFYIWHWTASAEI